MRNDSPMTPSGTARFISGGTLPGIPASLSGRSLIAQSEPAHLRQCGREALP